MIVIRKLVNIVDIVCEVRAIMVKIGLKKGLVNKIRVKRK